MAHHMEPMDVDCMDSDFDNKENTFHHSNVLPFTEKGYEELDVSELNMKLRYSMTPASSPMSKSYTAYVDNRNIDTDDSLNNSNENANLTRSLNSTMTKNDSVIKSLKCLPLQSLSTETFIDGNGNASVLRQLDSTITNTNNNITVTVSGTNDIDDNLSLPSASSSALHTPEATTPTKEIIKDGGSPIMRGLKSVLNMFRSSQSPIPPDEGDNIAVNKLERSYPTDVPIDECTKPQAVASTPIAAHRTKEGNTPKRSSPLKDSIVFNEDLEKELNWKDETTIMFNYEKIPVHKLFCQQTKHTRCQPAGSDVAQTPNIEDNLNSTVEYMDVSYNDSMLKDRTLTEQFDNSNNEVIVTVESDSEFLDCETTFTKSQSHILDTTDTEDKGLAVTANVLNIGVTNKDISLVADKFLDNSPISLDPTSMSLTDEECKNYVFEQPDYSYYSKETTQVLSEMEKSGDNIISKVVLLDPNIDSKDITSEKKEYVEPKAEAQEILTNVTLKENKQNCLIETIESKKNKELKTVEENNASISQSNESDILPVPKKIIKQIEYTKTLIESDNKNTQSILNDIKEDYEGVLSDVFDTTIGSDPLATVVDQKKMETTYIQYFNNTEIQFAGDSEICQSSIETSLVIPNTTAEMMSLDILDVTQNEIVPEELEILLTQEPADVPLPDDKCQKGTLTSLEPLNEKQNIVIPESTCLQTEMPSDIPLPDDDDDIDKEVTGVVPVLLPDEAVHVMPSEPKNVTNTITELDTSESILKGLSESVDEDKIRSYDILSDSMNKISSQLAEEPKVNTELDSITSDVKLQNTSSDCIIEKEIIPPGLGNIMSPEAEPSMLPRTLEPPHMDSTSDITEIEKSLETLTETNVIEHVIMPDVVSSPDKTNELDQTLEKIDKDMSQIVDVAQCVMGTLDTTATKENVEQADNKHSNEPMDITINRSLNQTHDLLEVTPGLTPKPLVLETVGVALDISEIVKSHDDLLPKIVSSPDKTTLDQTSEKIDKDICQLGHVTQVVKEDIEQVENKNQNEPMDITINESLSQTHDQLDVTPIIASNILCLQTANLTSDITENKKPLEDMTDSNVKENTILAGVASCPNNNNMTLKEISEQIIVNDITQIDNLHHATNTLDTTVPNEHTQQAQTKTQDRPMNINESLNDTQDLPDLVNQTIIINEENLQNLTDAMDTLTLPNEKLMVNNDNELLITRAKGKNDRISDYEEKSGRLENDTESQNNQSTTHENQGLTTDAQMNAEKDPKVQSENVQSNDPECVKKNTSNDQFDKSKTTESNSTKENNMEVQVTTVDEEIIMSGNNSPYVSLMAVPEKEEKGEEKFEEIVNPFVTNTPSSPPISSKGYNFNFDEMDDPFATKTKIRMSPTSDTPSKSVEEYDGKKKIITGSKKEVTNLRKFQPPEKKKLVPKKKFNMSVDSTGSKMRTDKRDSKEEDDNNKTNIEINYKSSQAKQVKETSTLDITIDTTEIQEANVCKEKEHLLCTSFKERNKILPGKTENLDEKKSLTDSIPTLNEIKTTSSLEHSVYCSAGASSVESVQSKNVFNIPEIDDVNFNPFASKSKMRRSPPRDLEVENPFATKTKIGISPNTSVVISPQLNSKSSEIINETKMAGKNYEDKIETELMEKETSNTTNATTSSYDTDNQDMTTREVNTEDEDTIEGPFLDADDIHKVTDFGVDNVDMMQCNDLPTHEAEDNLEGELFIDAEAFEFLLNQNKSNIVADSGKESLFLKFDPLFAKKISSDGVLAALTQVQKRQSTPTKLARPPLKNEASPIAGPSTLNVTYEGDTNASQESNDDFNITVSKPMMVVTPAVNPAVTPRNKSITPNRSNRRSVTFTSPAIAVIDRLLSMSANNSLMEQDATMIHVHREQTEANQALSQLRELLAEKEISVYNLRSESKELKDRLSTMESQVRILEADGQIRLKRINELNERLAEKTRDNKRMADVVEEYERTIASLIADTEQDKKRNAEERIKLINERDEQTAHLTSMEVSFSDLHSKYEKSKKIIRACKNNEDTYKKSIKDIGENLTKMQTNYEMLKQHATSKLNHANQELEKLNRAHEGEVVKLNAMIKRKDLHITSLEETLAQKMKANEELTAICDELINKVG